MEGIWPSLQNCLILFTSACFSEGDTSAESTDSSYKNRSYHREYKAHTCTNIHVDKFYNKGIKKGGYYFNIWRWEWTTSWREDVLKEKPRNMEYALPPQKTWCDWNIKRVTWQCLKEG